MKEKIARLLVQEKLIPFGIFCEIIGICFLCIGLFNQMPWVMILTMPAGMGLVGLGMLSWAYIFFKNL